MDTTDLDFFLSKFFAEVRAKKGTFYMKNGTLSLRYGLQMHYLNKFNIIDVAFKSANKTCAAVFVNLEREGKGKVNHMEPITKEDFARLYSSEVLNMSTPEGLQNKVFVDLIMHLCNRGRENLRDMKCSDSKFKPSWGQSRSVKKDERTRLRVICCVQSLSLKSMWRNLIQTLTASSENRTTILN